MSAVLAPGEDLSYEQFRRRVDELERAIFMTPRHLPRRVHLEEERDSLHAAFPHFSLAFILELELNYPKNEVN